MPEFRGKKVTNAKLADSKAVARWRSLILLRTSIDDAGLASLENVAMKLTEIQIVSDIISDEGLQVICRLPKIVSILLSGVPKVTDAGLYWLQFAPQLRELYLEGTCATDLGLKHLENLTSIWSLDLKGTKVTDEGLISLRNMPNLNILHLDGTRVTGSGLSWYTCKQRAYLYLDSCPVNDTAIDELIGPKCQLEILGLGHTAVTDLALPRLSECKTLVDLKLTGTRVTDEGVKLLEAI